MPTSSAHAPVCSNGIGRVCLIAYRQVGQVDGRGNLGNSIWETSNDLGTCTLVCNIPRPRPSLAYCASSSFQRSLFLQQPAPYDSQPPSPCSPWIPRPRARARYGKSAPRMAGTTLSRVSARHSTTLELDRASQEMAMNGIPRDRDCGGCGVGSMCT